MRSRFIFLLVALFAPSVAGAQLIPSADGLTVYDARLKVTWLANANLAGTPTGKFSVDSISPKGSMNYRAALRWIDALNNASYLGHDTWTLPTQPVPPMPPDASCSYVGPDQFHDRFGYNCQESDLGSLFTLSMNIPFPNTAVPIPDILTWPFHNFQPYLYRTSDTSSNNGHHTFSFNTGWTGSNVDNHYMYALPMVKGRAPGIYLPSGRGTLEVRLDLRLVYDPSMDITWLADADLAKTQWFGAQCQNSDGTFCITSDGSMQDSIMEKWIGGMRAAKYLGQSTWQLPSDSAAGAICAKWGCSGTPLGNLYYNQFGLGQGTPVVDAPNISVHGFNHLQPYLYWACGAPTTIPPCQNTIPQQDMGGSFSFGNGFQGTDLKDNQLYVMVYFPQTPADALDEAIEHDAFAGPIRNSLESLAAAITAAPDAASKAAAVQSFVDRVNSLRGWGLTLAAATQLTALAAVL